MTETNIEGFIHAPATKLFIDTKLASFNALEGEYVSYAYGKSEDYVDLREYQDGDSSRDIDWRATARSQETIIRRFREPKKHEIVFLFDTGLNMFGMTEDLKTKQLLSLQAAGILMHIALQHNDVIRVAYSDKKNVHLSPATTSKQTLEGLLNSIASLDTDTVSQHSTMKQSLALLNGALKSRSIIICFSDIYATEESYKELSSLANRHDILWLNFTDLSIVNKDHNGNYLDIETQTGYPETLRTDPEIIAAFHEAREEVSGRTTALLNSVKANHSTVSRQIDLLDALFALLAKQVKL